MQWFGRYHLGNKARADVVNLNCNTKFSWSLGNLDEIESIIIVLNKT